MKKLIVVKEHLENAGCNNGNYPRFWVIENGKVIYEGITCRCGNGCSNTERISDVLEELGCAGYEYPDFWVGENGEGINEILEEAEK